MLSIVALTGYQVVVTQSSDFNTRGPNHWFYQFVKPPEPGSLCDAHNFTLGDTLITSNTLFQWTVLSANITNPLATSVSYSGTNLDACAIWGISIDANSQTFTVDASFVVLCSGPDLPFVLQGTYTFTGGNRASYVTTFLRLNVQNVFGLPSDQITADNGQAFTGVAAVNSM